MRTSLVFRLALCAALLAGGVFAVVDVPWQQARGHGSVAHAQVAAGCTLASLSGSYGFSEAGAVLIGASGHPEPNGSTRLNFVEVGRSIFDGQGGVSITADTRNLEGQSDQLTGSGAYTVNPDCTGATSLSFSDGNAGHDAFVIVKNGRQLRIVGTDPGLLRAGTAARQ